jgi:hypothetical protein
MEPAHLFYITVDMWPIPFEINSRDCSMAVMKEKKDLGPLRYWPKHTKALGRSLQGKGSISADKWRQVFKWTSFSISFVQQMQNYLSCLHLPMCHTCTLIYHIKRYLPYIYQVRDTHLLFTLSWIGNFASP